MTFHLDVSSKLRRLLAMAAAVFLLFLMFAAPSRSEAATWTFKGGGFGHGVGMSAYGAYGMANAGYKYGRILGHYYRGIKNTKIEGKRMVKVLLDVSSSPRFSRASWACGKKINPKGTYRASLGKQGIFLARANGKPLAKCGNRLRTEADGTVYFNGHGLYRGGVEVVRGGGSMYLINLVPLNSYCRGVLAKEMIPSWPIESLKAFALAVRSIGLSSKGTHKGFDVYPDTRSQVYGGVAAEYPRTSRACAQTASRVLTYGGKIAMAVFSASSGGYTENAENVWFGEPIPYLKGVPDPWDKGSPYYRWTYNFSHAKLNSLLSSYVSGRLRAIQVTRTGVSGRVIWAKLRGTGGVTKIRGDSLQYALGLPDRLLVSISVR